MVIENPQKSNSVMETPIGGIKKPRWVNLRRTEREKGENKKRIIKYPETEIGNSHRTIQ
jgi:hypothetical protein